ncbi:MAG: hypothetical protein ACW98Y_04775 [Candidatus Thorarchaeota archaeon]|jgi:hypothetical protein
MQLGLTPEFYGTIALVVMIAETVIVVALMIGWLYGSRRMDIKLHHRIVYPATLIHAITVGAWMIPIALERLPIMLASPFENWYQITHDTLGIIAILLGGIMGLMFITKKEMPIKLLKKTRPVMLATVAIWIITFILGLYWYLIGHVWI